MKHLALLLLFTLGCNNTSKNEANSIIEKTEITEPIAFNLLDTVLKNLGIEKENCRLDLVALKENPLNNNETFLAIPEIVKRDENDDFYFEFNSHIIIADTYTGNIKQKYFESSKTNGWISDAVTLAEIKIDTAPFIVTNNKRAFGVRIYQYNNSKPNPYSSKTISLFLSSDNSLNKILDNYNIMEYTGEWDTDCYGEFMKEDKILIMSDKKNNEYFNIIIKNKITETENYRGDNGNCESRVKSKNIKTLLTYNGKEYIPVIK